MKPIYNLIHDWANIFYDPTIEIKDLKQLPLKLTGIMHNITMMDMTQFMNFILCLSECAQPIAIAFILIFMKIAMNKMDEMHRRTQMLDACIAKCLDILKTRIDDNENRLLVLEEITKRVAKTDNTRIAEVARS